MGVISLEFSVGSLEISDMENTEGVESRVCLKVVADVLKSGALRPISCAVSWSDEEFCVLLQHG